MIGIIVEGGVGEERGHCEGVEREKRRKWEKRGREGKGMGGKRRAETLLDFV